MSSDILPQNKMPARQVARWDVWLGAFIGAAALAVLMMRRGSAVDTLITWLFLGGILGALLVWSVDSLLTRIFR